MKFDVTARDVNGNAVVPSYIGVVYAQKGPGIQVNEVIGRIPPGQVWDVQLAVNRVFFTVGAGDFADESVTVNETRGRWSSDNPACTVTQRGDQVSLSLTIGSMRFAPTTYLPPEQLVKDNPRAALVDRVGGGEWMYRGAWLNPELLCLLKDPVFGDPDSKEWKRFNHTRLNVEPKNQGTFVLLEHGYPVALARNGPRFLIAAWAPRKALGETPQIVVYFSPTTRPPDYPPDSHPFVSNYPYAFVPLSPRKPLPVKEMHQPYVDLGINYLVTGYKILYQLLAAGRNPIVLMPIQASGQWGPFDAQSGMWRAVKEAVRFLYARKLVSGRAAPSTRLSLESGRTSTFPANGVFTDELVPDDFSVTISGFSAGINAVVRLCTVENVDDQKYSHVLFHSPPAPFREKWRETWDIDGVDSEGWNHLVQAFKPWLSARRRLRSYHSSTTYHGGPDNGLVAATEIVTKAGKAGTLQEGTSKDGRATWVYFSNSYLTGDTKDPQHEKTIPEFGTFDAHHFVPAIAFGHAGAFPPP